METTTWNLDPTHSEINFKVKHLMISNVKGEFQEFDGEIESIRQDFDKAKLNATVKSDSVYTNNKDRDIHLRSADFFDTEKHKTISFVGTSFEKLDTDNYKLTGLLTIKGTAKEVNLDVDYGGMMKDPYGNQKAGFSFTGKINRKDWGLNWNAILEAGGVMVSDEVRINGELQFIKQA
ncbi:polyisoprenoid-binding protein YceI [Salegentibacter sp. 24]|uniref:YceI family protein n=1 Tax=Salegentibacter sp. 24 TaxID=2183986 RepID=UPI001060BE37|nr:YceI family protein [Salegentibacter sp. 24]TDN83835.1 polyisoprenoid-binding protein YceI [Salegentibacter sp. 24]